MTDRTGLVRLGQIAFRRRGLLLPIAILLFILPGPRLTDGAAAIGVMGLLVALIGQTIRVGTIGLAYIIRGGKDHQVYAEDLVTTGIYAHTRNPMYFGNAFLLAGLAVASNSWLVVSVGVPLALLWHAAIIAAEEDFLRRKFGAGFDAYCARVPRIIPRLGGVSSTFRSMRFDWRRVLVQEYAKPFDWIAAIAVMVLMNLWRDGQFGAHRGLAVLLIAIIAARLVLWFLAVQLKSRPAGLAGSR